MTTDTEAGERKMKLISAESKVLAVLCEQHVDYACIDFATIGSDAQMERKDVRRACRSLKRKGLAEFYSGLWSDEGEPRGSGYCASPSGRALLEGE